mgnify:CR=1 FL=1
MFVVPSLQGIQTLVTSCMDLKSGDLNRDTFDAILSAKNNHSHIYGALKNVFGRAMRGHLKILFKNFKFQLARAGAGTARRTGRLGGPQPWPIET